MPRDLWPLARRSLGTVVRRPVEERREETDNLHSPEGSVTSRLAHPKGRTNGFRGLGLGGVKNERIGAK